MDKSSICRISRLAALCMGIALSTALGGCGGVDLLPVTGTVTLDGQPCAGAAVAFTPAEAGAIGNGVTDSEGRFVLQTINDCGLPPGHYRVAVILQELPPWADSPTGPLVEPPPGSPPLKWIVPQRYSSPATSGLVADVTPDSPPFNFALTHAVQATQ